MSGRTSATAWRWRWSIAACGRERAGAGRRRWPAALGVALLVACLVELGQLLGLLALLGLADVPVARVVLGGAFDPSDFAAYALGGAGVALVERARRWHV